MFIGNSRAHLIDQFELRLGRSVSRTISTPNYSVFLANDDATVYLRPLLVSFLKQTNVEMYGPRRNASCACSCDRYTADPQTGVAPGVTRGRNVRSRYRCSMCPAIHINSRTWLRSSSTHEPSDPPLRVISSRFVFHAVDDQCRCLKVTQTCFFAWLQFCT